MVVNGQSMTGGQLSTLPWPSPETFRLSLVLGMARAAGKGMGCRRARGRTDIEPRHPANIMANEEAPRVDYVPPAVPPQKKDLGSTRDAESGKKC